MGDSFCLTTLQFNYHTHTFSPPYSESIPNISLTLTLFRLLPTPPLTLAKAPVGINSSGIWLTIALVSHDFPSNSCQCANVYSFTSAFIPAIKDMWLSKQVRIFAS